MHQFHLNQASLIQVKFEKGGNPQFYDGVMALFYLDFGQIVSLWFPIINFWRDATISFKFYRRVQHHKIQVNLELGGHLQIFD